MSDPSTDSRAAESKPEALTPEAQAVLKRARRSFGVSVGILLLGFMAIAFALVYRVMRDAPPPAVAEVVTLPAGAEVVSSLVADGAVNVTYRVAGETVLALYDPASGELIRQIALETP
jgi:hypothetical protein